MYLPVKYFDLYAEKVPSKCVWVSTMDAGAVEVVAAKDGPFDKRRVSSGIGCDFFFPI